MGKNKDCKRIEISEYFTVQHQFGSQRIYCRRIPNYIRHASTKKLGIYKGIERSEKKKEILWLYVTKGIWEQFGLWES